MLWICSGSLGYKSSRYCTFEPIKVLSLPKKKKPVSVKKNKFILHTCECRYDNNMNKAGKSPPPVQTNRNINNPPPILTFKFCIRLADLSLAVKYKFYWCATSTRSPNSISCQYNFMSFYQHLKLFMKNYITMPVIPLALIVHNI